MAEQLEQLPEETPWESFDSTNILAMRRLPDGTVGVRFKNRNGEFSGEYNYAGISEDLFERWRTADSVGSFFHVFIKPNSADYPATKVPPPVPVE